MADMYQNIREKMPSSQITVRNWFKDEPNDSKIKESLELCFRENELKNLYAALCGNGIKKTLNPFDSNIKEILSGGQKSRLCLTTRLYEIISSNKEFLILDEPEQGSDAKMIEWVLNNIFYRFKNKRIIMITHMCQCRIKELHVDWTHQLKVQGGLIKEFIM